MTAQQTDFIKLAVSMFRRQPFNRADNNWNMNCVELTTKQAYFLIGTAKRAGLSSKAGHYQDDAWTVGNVRVEIIGKHGVPMLFVEQF